MVSSKANHELHHDCDVSLLEVGKCLERGEIGGGVQPDYRVQHRCTGS